MKITEELSKGFCLGAMFVLLAVSFLAADGGYSMNWKQELSRERNQRELFDVIQRHCNIVESEHIVPTDGTQPYDTGSRLNCYAYDEK